MPNSCEGTRCGLNMRVGPGAEPDYRYRSCWDLEVLALGLPDLTCIPRPTLPSPAQCCTSPPPTCSAPVSRSVACTVCATRSRYLQQQQ